jgi:hypothetical protein
LKPATVTASAEPASAESDVNLESITSSSDVGAPIWPDESVESAFLAEARDRGEKVALPKAPEEVADERDTAPLPPLNELVERIPAEVRDVLDELFRARFVTVKRIPKSALKN